MKSNSYIRKKKKNCNDLCSVHLKAEQEWGSTWHVILDCVHKSVNRELERKYKTIKEKLKKTCAYPHKKPRL